MTPLARAVAYLKRARYSVETELAKSGLSRAERYSLAMEVARIEESIRRVNLDRQTKRDALAEVTR